MRGYERLKADFGGKKVLVMGLGILGGGVGVAKFFSKIGCELTITDLRSEQELKKSLEKLMKVKASYVLGKHRHKDFKSVDVVIRNPGVPKDSEYIKVARESGRQVLMDVALFAKYTQKPVIGVTGTRGKTTTSYMIHKVLSAHFGNVKIGGNIVGGSTLELLENETDETLATVLELSSWQLQGFKDLRISPQYSVITNIYPDHLNRYKSMDDYVEDKKSVFKYQSDNDWLFINKNDEELVKASEETKSKVVSFGIDDLPENLQLKIPGLHNRMNAAACFAVARAWKVPVHVITKKLNKFESVPHRLEKVGEVDGISYINDTTSTTPVALIAAVKAIKGPIYLIMGGNSKNLPIDDLVSTLNKASNIKGILMIPGSGTDEIRKMLKGEKIIGEFEMLDEALIEAVSRAIGGDTVLFSPGFTSFAQFKNEFDRGETFNGLVKNL